MKDDYIGKRVNLKISNVKLGGVVHTLYDLDDPAMVAEIKEAFGASTRIFPPRTGGTTDFKPFRTNVFLDEDGVIISITNG